MAEISSAEYAPLESRVIKRIEYPLHMNRQLVESWAEGIPLITHVDPEHHPEWRPTPLKSLDLNAYGAGKIWVKDESDRESNPTGNIKDRAAWELTTLYRDYARTLAERLSTNQITHRELNTTLIPRLTLITSGNEGVAIAESFKRFGVPPPKLVMDTNTPQEMLEMLAKFHAEIYVVDLSTRPLSKEEILALSDNPNGIDISSDTAIRPQAIFYDWHVHEVFNEEPDYIFVPYGSGRLMENYLYWQDQTFRNDSEGGVPDPRLKTSSQKIRFINVIGAEPSNPNSRANKLTAKFKPFLIFKDGDISTFVKLGRTGKNTGKLSVSDTNIQEAEEIYNNHLINAEPSGAAGLGKYLELSRQGKIPDRAKVIVVNTGLGLLETLKTKQAA